ncbi:Aminotransferase-like, plant mobile domain [Dillenia turbinata]|uniref:Aminotransferase-like, plant mobile domain n=1 Tax=Dillenia turbinata TaxID=194707 RepID=A0AAN8UQH1_9MAGN
MQIVCGRIKTGFDFPSLENDRNRNGVVLVFLVETHPSSAAYLCYNETARSVLSFSCWDTARFNITYSKTVFTIFSPRMDPFSYNPGPIDYSVLYEQDKHISSAIWDGEDRGVLRCHDRSVKVAPNAEHATGGMVKLSWLRSSFSNCPEDANMEVTLQHTRAYILYLMGSTIFSTTTGNKVPVMYLQFLEDFDTVGNYAWGAAALSYLYKVLGNASLKGQSNICGSVTLLQCWSYEHLKVGRQEFVEAGDWFPLALRWKRKSNS